MFEELQHFDFFHYELLNKDLCYMKPLSLRFKLQNESSSCEFDQVVQFKANRCTIAENIKLKKELGKFTTLQVSSSNNFFKAYCDYRIDQPPEDHQDLDLSKFAKEVALYGAVHTDRKLQNASVQIGFKANLGRSNINANLTSYLNEKKADYFLYAKILHLTQRYNIGLLSIFDCSCKNLQTNDVVLEVKPHQKHHLFFRAEVDGLRNYSMNYAHFRNYFDFLSVNYLMRPTETLTLMAEFKYDVNYGKIKHIESFIEKKFPNRKLRVKINSLADITFQYQLPLTFGSSSSLDFGLLLADSLKSRKISYGFRVNLNY